MYRVSGLLQSNAVRHPCTHALFHALVHINRDETLMQLTRYTLKRHW
jgi:hypothetical protein